MEGQQDSFTQGFELLHCMLGPSSYPLPYFSPSSGPLLVSGRLHCPNSKRGGDCVQLDSP